MDKLQPMVIIIVCTYRFYLINQMLVYSLIKINISDKVRLPITCFKVQLNVILQVFII